MLCGHSALLPRISLLLFNRKRCSLAEKQPVRSHVRKPTHLEGAFDNSGSIRGATSIGGHRGSTSSSRGERNRFLAAPALDSAGKIETSGSVRPNAQNQASVEH